MGISSTIPPSRLIQPGVCTSSTRPTSPFEGQVIYETDTDRTLVWSGSAWVGTGSLAGLQIDSSGRVTTPLRPAFRYHGWTIDASGMRGGTAPLNVGSHLTIATSPNYSKFTAPIAGLYWFAGSVLIQESAGRAELYFRKNGTGTFDGYSFYSMNDVGVTGGGYANLVGSYIFYLAANDYIDMAVSVAGTLWADSTRGDRVFQGYLIG